MLVQELYLRGIVGVHKTHLLGMPSLSVLESDFKQLLAVLNLFVRRNTGFGRSLVIIGL